MESNIPELQHDPNRAEPYNSFKAHFGRNLVRFNKPSSSTKLFLVSSASGTQLSLWSMVMPSKRIFVTHLRVEFPCSTGAIGPIWISLAE